MIHIKEGKSMARALAILGHTVAEEAANDYGAQPLYYTTPEGIEAAKMLTYARTKISSTWVGLARRFTEQPDVWTEFCVVHRLDGDAPTLGAVLAQLHHVRSREARRLQDTKRGKRFGRGRR